MKLKMHIYLLLIAPSTLAGQTLFNFKYLELMMLQRTKLCYGIQIENKKFRAEFNTGYSVKSDDQRFSECTSHPDKHLPFIHGRFGITALQTAKKWKTKSHKEFVPKKNLGNGWFLGKIVTVSEVYAPSIILEPGVDYYRYFATTSGSERIYGTNGQFIGNVVGSNMEVVSGYGRLTFQRELGNGGVIRFFGEYMQAINIKMEDVKYGFVTTGLKGDGNSGFNYKKWGLKFGVELYAPKFVSTRFALGSSPGIKGRNSFATFISLGFPLTFGK